MRIFIVPILSLIISALYYAPWLVGPTPLGLGLYKVAFYWLLIIWTVAIFYFGKAFSVDKKKPSKKSSYLIGSAMILLSYMVVLIGVFDGYIVSFPK